VESQLIQYVLLISPIQGQKQNSQHVSSCVKRNPKKTPAKSPELLTPPDTPLAINLGDGKLKNSNKYIFVVCHTLVKFSSPYLVMSPANCLDQLIVTKHSKDSQ